MFVREKNCFIFLKEEVILVLDLQTCERNVGKCNDHNLQPFHFGN